MCGVCVCMCGVGMCTHLDRDRVCVVFVKTLGMCGQKTHIPDRICVVYVYV